MMEELDRLMVIDRIDDALRAIREVGAELYHGSGAGNWVSGRTEGRADAFGDAAASALHSYRACLTIQLGFPEPVRTAPDHRLNLTGEEEQPRKEPVTRLRAIVRSEPEPAA